MTKVFVCSLLQSFDEMLEYAKEHRYNMEIGTFATPRILDTNWQEVLKDYQRKLHEFKGTISTHGAFWDLNIPEVDEKIIEVTEQRIFQSLEIAKELKAKHTVFHSPFNWLIQSESYKLKWVKRSASFWSKVLEKYPSSTVVLENTLDFTPEMLRRVIDEVDSPRLKACIDMGHMNVFSKVPLEEWIAVLGEDIGSMHINDNKGDFDSHLAPGKGTINWQELSDLIAKYHIHPDIVFEVGLEGGALGAVPKDTLKETIQSLNYFREENIYPFNTYVGT